MARNLSDEQKREEIIAAIINDLSRIRDGLTDYLTRLRTELKNRDKVWRIEVLPQLSGGIDVRPHRLTVIKDEDVVREIEGFYSNLVFQEEEASALDLDPLSKIPMFAIHFTHFVITIAQGKGIALHHRLTGGKSVPIARNAIEAETLELTARWNAQSELFQEVDHRYPIVESQNPMLQ